MNVVKFATKWYQKTVKDNPRLRAVCLIQLFGIIMEIDENNYKPLLILRLVEEWSVFN